MIDDIRYEKKEAYAPDTFRNAEGEINDQANRIFVGKGYGELASDERYKEPPEGLSREPVDVRRRFEAARSRRASIYGYAGVKGIRSHKRGEPSEAIQSGMVQGEPGKTDTGVRTDFTRAVATKEPTK